MFAKLSVLFCLGTVVVAFASETTLSPTPVISPIDAFYCKHENAYYRHPTDVHKFIQCVNGVPYEFDCPNKLVWNQSVHQCDYTTGPNTGDDDDVGNHNHAVVTLPPGHRERHTNAPYFNTEDNNFEVTTQEVVTRGRHHH